MHSKNTAALSLPQSKTVRGYEVKRLALGGYLQAIHTLNTLPGGLLEACFPGKSAGEALSQLMRADGPMFHLLTPGLVQTGFDHLLCAASALTGIPLDDLKEDTTIGLDGIIEILQAWVEINNLEDFTKAVRKLVAGFRAAFGKVTSILPPNFGSSV